MLYLCPYCLSKHSTHDIYPIAQIQFFQALNRDTAELKRRNQLLNRSMDFLDRVAAREAASQVEAQFLLTTVMQEYATWLEKNHRCFENLLEALREETALLVTSIEYRSSPWSQLLQQSSLDSEAELKFVQTPEIDTLLTLKKHCEQIYSKPLMIYQAEYNQGILQSFLPSSSVLIKSNQDAYFPDSQEPVPDYLSLLALKALEKFGSYPIEDDESELRKQGPVRVSSGTYTGQWNLRGQKHGYGILSSANGDLYEGHWRNDEKSGKGRQIYGKDGKVYIGDWVHGRREGFGNEYNLSGTEFSGAFQNDCADGFGAYRLQSGDYQFGELKNGAFNGRSATFLADGGMFVGWYQSGKCEGQGLQVFGSGELYFGNFEGGKYSGIGWYIWPDGNLYQGEWKQNMKHGRGKNIYPGRQEEGVWVDNVKRR